MTTFFDSIFGDETAGTVAVPLVDASPAVQVAAADPGLVDDADPAGGEPDYIYWHCGPIPRYAGSPRPLCSPPAASFDPDRLTRVLDCCDRCGSTAFVDVLIHDGQSRRRDCGKCNRFLSFPRWYGRQP